MGARRRMRARMQGGATRGRGSTALVLTLAVGGLTACGSEPTSPGLEAELQAVQEDVDELRDRVEALEQQPPSGSSGEQDPPPGEGSGAGDEQEPPDSGQPQPFDDPAGLFEDPESLIGQDVTVTARVAELLSVAEVGAAFRIGNEDGTTVGVITATPPADLQVGDVLQVTGRVGRIDPTSFEADFGISADVLAEEPEAFLAGLDGDVAIAARQLEVVEEPAG
jgi:hypothetical protein